MHPFIIRHVIGPVAPVIAAASSFANNDWYNAEVGKPLTEMSLGNFITSATPIQAGDGKINERSLDSHDDARIENGAEFSIWNRENKARAVVMRFEFLCCAICRAFCYHCNCHIYRPVEQLS